MLKNLLTPICLAFGHRWKYSSGLYMIAGKLRPVRHSCLCTRCGLGGPLPFVPSGQSLGKGEAEP